MPILARAMLRPLAFLVASLLPAVAGAHPARDKSGATARLHKFESKANDPGSRAAVPQEESRHGASSARSNGNGPSRACFSQPVELVAGRESAIFSLTKCDGSATPLAVDQLSVLARPSTSSKPKQPLEILANAAGTDLAPGVRRFDARIVERLAQVIERFHAAGETPQVILVSGYRRRGEGSYHSVGRAVDFRVAGVTNEALVAICRTLPDTGCGYYPNSGFVHMDVRDPGAGHVSWIDVSRPGQPPRYVTRWPALEPLEPAELPALPAADAQVSTSAPRERKNSGPPSI
ncbi:MAG: DUF882 domain-containing protein [Myxococcota bacterium]|nr:DUF882 domain-containing protein [Myxococcota bacterium]